MVKKYPSQEKSIRASYMCEYRAKLKSVVYGFYGNECACCGEKEILFLTIDHKNNDGFKDKYPRGKNLTSEGLWRKIIKEGLPEKYQILCYNCNIGKRIKGGVCPHLTT